ncbi:MAG TPA: redoxin domain-containing protein [Anaerolineae bacterium]|jgi:peroxiredoxin|nr:redoxin domain-containing protein [Anaerolineae bacterium]
MDQLVELVEDSAKFEASEAQVIAIAHQTQNGALRSVENTNAQFPILVDMDHAVSDAYGVYVQGVLPSVFIIDQDGQILWHDVATSARSDRRVPSRTILEHLPDLNG